MNSYQLISKLKKIRGDTYLTTADQALYNELVSVCNESKWKEVFFIRSNTLCGNLNMSDNTLRKSRKSLADAGLLSFESCKDKRIGCYYSFVKKLSNDNASSSISSANSEDDIADEVADDDKSECIESSAITSAQSSAIIEDDNNSSPAISSANSEDETQIPPYIDMKTKNNRESLAHTHEPPPPKKQKSSRKKEGDGKPLVYPFTSIEFMSAWEMLVTTPKWKKKLNLALQMSLDKLSKYPEEFAIYQVNRAIESNWAGVVFPDTPSKYQEWLKNGNKKQTDNDACADIIIRSTQG